MEKEKIFEASRRYDSNKTDAETYIFKFQFSKKDDVVMCERWQNVYTKIGWSTTDSSFLKTNFQSLPEDEDAVNFISNVLYRIAKINLMVKRWNNDDRTKTVIN